MRGRKPNPAPLKLLRGNPGKRSVPAEPVFEDGRPPRPRWLKGEAAREWDRVVPQLQRARLLKLVDRAALIGYCTAWAHFAAAESYIGEHGPIGPQWSLRNKALQQVRAFATEFGFTPSSRSRIALPQGGGEDEFEDFLSEGTGG